MIAYSGGGDHREETRTVSIKGLVGWDLGGTYFRGPTPFGSFGLLFVWLCFRIARWLYRLVSAREPK